jgi:hypothetical protein
MPSRDRLEQLHAATFDPEDSHGIPDLGPFRIEIALDELLA